MTEVHRTNLEWARDVARAYRSALRIVAPEKCKELDDLACARGQHWIAPTFVPAEAVDRSLDEKLPAAAIERFWGVKAATIRSWARTSRRDPDDPTRPLLPQYPGPKGPLYIPREVLAVESRHRRERHLPRAAGQ